MPVESVRVLVSQIRLRGDRLGVPARSVVFVFAAILGIAATPARDARAGRRADTLLAADGRLQPRACGHSSFDEGYESLCADFNGSMKEFTKAWDDLERAGMVQRLLEDRFGLEEFFVPSATEPLAPPRDRGWEKGPLRRYVHHTHSVPENPNWYRVFYVQVQSMPTVGRVTIQCTRPASPSEKLPIAGHDGTSAPELISRAPVNYPEWARLSRLQGRVLLQLVVQADGSVREPLVLQAFPPHVGFEEAAVESLRRWRYKPALRNHEPVDAMLIVPVSFAFK